MASWYQFTVSDNLRRFCFGIGETVTGTDQAMSLHANSRKVVEKRSKAAEGEAPRERARLRRWFEDSLGISNLQTDQTVEAPLRSSNGLKNSG